MTADQSDAQGIVAEGASKKTFRPDIQGLRMVAVVAVVLDHLVGWPAGGFVGVDVFFVISGFLITSLLLRESEKTGTISFTGFYRRRIKRIIPAAVAVLVVTVAASWFLFSSARFTSTLWDAVWAFFFASNWHFIAVGTDYFTADSAVSPLQHFWSLSVEEQFYMVWPWLMLLLLVLSGVRRRRRSDGVSPQARSRVLIALVVVIVASFGWSLYETATSPTWAYFSTFSRAWELGLGALIAVLAPLLLRIPTVLRRIAGWGGLALILVSLFVVTEDGGFPAPMAALPVLATALVIVSGTGGEAGVVALTNPVSRWFGDISYSLYLWHFPVIVLLAVVMPGRDWVYILICVVVMGVLSVASYYGLENPIRRSSWLEPRTRPTSTALGTTSPARRSILLGGLAVLVVGTVALVLVAVTPSGPAADTDGPLTAASEPLEEEDLAQALTATSWPDRELSGDYLKGLQAPDVNSSTCFNDFEEESKSCTYNEGGSPRIALVGDSIAMSWAPAIRAAFPEAQVTTFGKFSCPWVDILVETSRDPEYQSCLDYHQWTYGQLDALKPDLVVASNADFQLARVVAGSGNDGRRDEWTSAMQPTLEKLTAAGASVVVLSNPVPGYDLAECATRLNGPKDCERELDGQYERLATANGEGTATATEKGMDVSFVDGRDWFCTTDGRCPVLFEGVPIRADAVHVTENFALRIAPNVRDAIMAAVPAVFAS